MTTSFRDPIARDRAWGRYYARCGTARAVARARHGIPLSPRPDEQRTLYQRRLARFGYDPRDLARRAAAGARLQDRLKATRALDRLRPDPNRVVIRSTRDNPRSAGEPCADLFAGA